MVAVSLSMFNRVLQSSVLPGWGGGATTACIGNLNGIKHNNTDMSHKNLWKILQKQFFLLKIMMQTKGVELVSQYLPVIE